MSDNVSTKIRESVSRAYSAALKKATSGSSDGCCAGQAAQLVDYSEAAGELPESARNSSFGCGNPVAFAGVGQGEAVLDLGSGAGLDLLLAARKVGPTGKVIGIDMNDDMIAAARANASKAGFANVEIRKSIIEELPVADASIDWVISNCVINLSPEKERVFAEIARVLKPGGRFSISDIVVDELPAALREHAAAYAACISGAISEPQYVAGLQAAGLREVRIEDKHVYSAEELRAIVGSDLESFGLDARSLDRPLEEAAGKVCSARIVGEKPRSA
jgi:SAM-dependent methyltransferase